MDLKVYLSEVNGVKEAKIVREIPQEHAFIDLDFLIQAWLYDYLDTHFFHNLETYFGGKEPNKFYKVNASILHNIGDNITDIQLSSLTVSDWVE